MPPINEATLEYLFYGIGFLVVSNLGIIIREIINVIRKSASQSYINKETILKIRMEQKYLKEKLDTIDDLLFQIRALKKDINEAHDQIRLLRG